LIVIYSEMIKRLRSINCIKTLQQFVFATLAPPLRTFNASEFNPGSELNNLLQVVELQDSRAGLLTSLYYRTNSVILS